MLLFDVLISHHYRRKGYEDDRKDLLVLAPSKEALLDYLQTTYKWYETVTIRWFKEVNVDEVTLIRESNGGQR